MNLQPGGRYAFINPSHQQQLTLVKARAGNVIGSLLLELLFQVSPPENTFFPQRQYVPDVVHTCGHASTASTLGPACGGKLIRTDCGGLSGICGDGQRASDWSNGWVGCWIQKGDVEMVFLQLPINCRY